MVPQESHLGISMFLCLLRIRVNVEKNCLEFCQFTIKQAILMYCNVMNCGNLGMFPWCAIGDVGVILTTALFWHPWVMSLCATTC
jgi:hypothetical protein